MSSVGKLVAMTTACPARTCMPVIRSWIKKICLHENGPAASCLGWQGVFRVLGDLRLSHSSHKLQPDLTIHALAVCKELSILWLLGSGLQALQKPCRQVHCLKQTMHPDSQMQNQLELCIKPPYCAMFFDEGGML